MVLDNATTTPEPLAIRVDLTSQDLRTGTIRLPRRLHDHFEPGGLDAQETQGAAVHRLQFLPPRELTGLQEFLQSHDLRPNDAVIMHVDGQQLRLEPYYRSHRRQEAEGDDPTGIATNSPHEEPTGEPSNAATDSDAASTEPVSDENVSGEPSPESAGQDSPDIQDASDTIHEHPTGV